MPPACHNPSVYKLLSKIWKLLGKKTQWFAAWLIHAKFSVGVSLVIPSEDGRVLLGKHVFSGNKPWRLIGGYMNRGEHVFDAAKREAKEELGIDIVPMRIIRIRSGFRYRVEFTVVTELVPADTGLKIDHGELHEVGWFAAGNEPEGTLSSHLETLRVYREGGEVVVENL